MMPIKRTPKSAPLGLIVATFCLTWIPVYAQDAEPGNVTKAIETSDLPGVDRVFRDCPTCPEMVIIPAGSFDMGSPKSEDGRDDNEGPVHRVNISTFALGKTEITRSQFTVFVKDAKYIVGDNCKTLEGSKFEKRSGRNWHDLGFLQTSQHPAACINWDDAQAYAGWMSHKTGKHYRLPTEAEWEYAARGLTITARYWGDSPDKACGYANVADKTAQEKIPGATFWQLHNCTDGFAYTTPVGNLKANSFGLNDMLGNVWEWTEDSFHDSYKDAPVDGSTWQGNGEQRVLRGGSWNSGPARVRSAKRGRDTPATRISNIGFRLARTLP
jgi:formylglycine-generating enzyme required for sulfatase activity